MPLIVYQGGHDPGEPLLHAWIHHRGTPSHHRGMGKTPSRNLAMVCG